MASKNALKRILNKDIKEIINQKLNNNGIYIVFDEENMLSAKAMIVGPKDSLYESGFLFFNIQFPKNYPYSPPDLSYISRNRVRIHPNLYVGKSVRNKEQPIEFDRNHGTSECYIFEDKGILKDEEGNIISDKTVVEFYYVNDPNIIPEKRWIPINSCSSI